MSSEESDEVYDEIDRFHMDDDTSDSEKGRRTGRYTQEEVLNVEGDTSEDDNDDEDSFFESDSENVDANNMEKFLPSANKWGKKRRTFYNTSYVDEDWGGMNDDEVVLAELEEEDATMRQKRLDSELAHVSFDIEEQEKEVVESPSIIPDIEQMSENERFNYFLATNLEFTQMVAEYNEKKDFLLRNVMPLLETAEAVSNLKRGTVLEKQLRLSVGVFSRYLMNIIFYFHLKISTGICHGAEKKCLDNHPVLDSILSLRKKVELVEDFFKKNKSGLERLQKQVESASLSIDFIDSNPVIESVRKARKSTGTDIMKAAAETSVVEQESDYQECQYDEDVGTQSTSKRSITSQIEKNKGLSAKRKKGTQHSRVKKRKQFKKALIKKRSQRGDIRKELKPYSGEMRGIRASTVKSIKLKA